MFGHSMLLRISKYFLLTLFVLSVFLYLLKIESRLVEKQSNNCVPQRKYALYGRHVSYIFSFFPFQSYHLMEKFKSQNKKKNVRINEAMRPEMRLNRHLGGGG